MNWPMFNHLCRSLSYFHWTVSSIVTLRENYENDAWGSHSNNISPLFIKNDQGFDYKELYINAKTKPLKSSCSSCWGRDQAFKTAQVVWNKTAVAFYSKRCSCGWQRSHISLSLTFSSLPGTVIHLWGQEINEDKMIKTVNKRQRGSTKANASRRSLVFAH